MKFLLLATIGGFFCSMTLASRLTEKDDPLPLRPEILLEKPEPLIQVPS